MTTTDTTSIKEKLFGQDYPYYKYVKTPQEIGMSNKGTLDQLGKDLDGLVNYVELLVSGKSKASATGEPLGNKFFLKTGAKCIANDTKETVDRYVYINNVPEGNIPIVSSGLGVDFSDFKGLIPGAISNLNAFNPMTIMQSFTQGTSPTCQNLTMETIDVNNQKGNETHYVTVTDIQNIDPCSFADNINPITKQKCREAFSNIRKQYHPVNINVTKEITNTMTSITPNITTPVLICLGLAAISTIYIMRNNRIKT